MHSGNKGFVVHLGGPGESELAGERASMEQARGRASEGAMATEEAGERGNERARGEREGERARGNRARGKRAGERARGERGRERARGERGGERARCREFEERPRP